MSTNPPTTAAEMVEALDSAEQKIINVAYGWATSTDYGEQRRQEVRLRDAVRDHHGLLHRAKGLSPTMLYEMSCLRAQQKR